MQVILIQDVDNLGGKSELVTVKNGYGRNFLLPQGLAVLATHSTKKVLAETLKQRAFKEKKIIEDVDGVSGATVQWDEGKGYPINKEHLDPSKQALIDFQDSILNNTTPKSDIITGAKTALCVQMGLDAMYNNKIVKWNTKLL